MDLDLSGVSSKSISYRSQDELVESSMATPTTPFLKDCEVVNYASTENPEIIATPEDHIPTESEASETAGEFDVAECSRARKLNNVCDQYQEAAIYLQEGEENEKLLHHPTDAKSYWAYKVIHNPVYYVTECIICVLLMLLAFLEWPAFFENIPSPVAPSLELLFLLCISCDVVLKLLWIKPKFTFRHRRTVLKCLLLMAMLVETIVILTRGHRLLHVVRALRPLFLVDSILLQDVRRILRQIFLSLGPIIDVMILFFFFLTFFALSGFYLFATDSPTNYEFRSFRETFISLYILTTTANFPDVMMESYNRNPWTPLFFVIFLIVVLYLINNVLLAMVYASFQDYQKLKFKKLYLHRRNALRHAFHVLTEEDEESEESEHKILKLQSYLKMMEHYSPFKSKLTATCTFKAMIKEGGKEELTIDDFYSFYDIKKLKWSRITGYGEKIRWYHILPLSTGNKLRLLTKAVRSVYFKAIMNLIVLSNALYYCIVTAHIKDPAKRFDKAQEALTVNFVYVGIYILEIIIKLIALGPFHFCGSFWNMFDFTVTISTFVIQLFEIHHPYLSFVIPIRFIRLVRFNRRFRAIFNTLAILFSQIVSCIILLLLIYYFFAIIGMEIFSGKVYRGCCNDNDTGIGMYYAGNGSNVYYLNNFNNLPRSYVTLFELMVVNNWWIIMEGFRIAVMDRGSRAFFIYFHLSTVVVLTVVIAFIVEAFVFKIHLAHQRFMTKNKEDYTLDGEFLNRCKVKVNKEEIEMLEKNFKRAYWTWELPAAFRQHISAEIPVEFQGIRRRTKGDLHKQLYKDHLTEWIKEDKRSIHRRCEARSSTTLFRKLKNVISCTLSYIFE